MPDGSKIFVKKSITDARERVYESVANDFAVIQFISGYPSAFLACFLTETLLLLYKNQTQDTCMQMESANYNRKWILVGFG